MSVRQIHLNNTVFKLTIIMSVQTFTRIMSNILKKKQVGIAKAKSRVELAKTKKSVEPTKAKKSVEPTKVKKSVEPTKTKKVG